jgi:calcineurin-like phosphoesterase family protein
MIFVTAQTRFSQKEFETSEKVKIWNSIVTDEDTVYCIGDFATDPLNCANVLDELNGNIVILEGVLDFDVFTCIDESLGAITQSIEILEDFDVVFSYWCLLDWFNKDENFYQIYGKQVKDKPKNSICAAWDIWKRPMRLEDLIDFCKIENK